jgi:hypothetical protein
MAAHRSREFKYYRLTENDRRQLLVEASHWKQIAEAVGCVMWAEESRNAMLGDKGKRRLHWSLSFRSDLELEEEGRRLLDGAHCALCLR